MVGAEPARYHLDGGQQSLCREDLQFLFNGMEIVARLVSGGILPQVGERKKLYLRKAAHIALHTRCVAEGRAQLAASGYCN